MIAMPAASTRAGQQSTVTSLIDQIAGKLKLRPVVPQDPMTSAMYERVTVTRRVFKEQVDFLAAGEADKSLSRVGPHENADTDEVPGTSQSKRARTTLPRMAQDPSDSDTRSKAPRVTSSGRKAA